MVEGTGLENRHTERYLGFESLTLRQKIELHLRWGFFLYFSYNILTVRPIYFCEWILYILSKYHGQF